jgi:hypothetical protein
MIQYIIIKYKKNQINLIFILLHQMKKFLKKIIMKIIMKTKMKIGTIIIMMKVYLKIIQISFSRILIIFLN